MTDLGGLRVAILIDDSFEEAELVAPRKAVDEAGAAKGRRIASWPSLKTDLRNAGGEWVNEEVVVDGNLVSSRKPDDIPAFNKAIVDVFNHVRAQV